MNLLELRDALTAGQEPGKMVYKPSTASFKNLTMIGAARLGSIRTLLELTRNVPGDVIETGVWAGGCCIWMRAVLDDLGSQKLVYAADSFRGLPKPTWKQDEGDRHWQNGWLSVELDDVKRNFASMGVPTSGVVFVEGWFKDTLPTLDGHAWSVIRLDGDMYESTAIALASLYPGLSAGGFCVIDDYGDPGKKKQAKAATDEFRERHRIEAPLVWVDANCVYWRKP